MLMACDILHVDLGQGVHVYVQMRICVHLCSVYVYISAYARYILSFY